jgi:hypothetical protein
MARLLKPVSLPATLRVGVVRETRENDERNQRRSSRQLRVQKKPPAYKIEVFGRRKENGSQQNVLKAGFSAT